MDHSAAKAWMGSSLTTTSLSQEARIASLQSLLPRLRELSETNNLELLTSVACYLIQDVICLTEQERTCLDQCLEACGSHVTLRAVATSLAAAAHRPIQSEPTLSPLPSLETALRFIQRILLSPSNGSPDTPSIWSRLPPLIQNYQRSSSLPRWRQQEEELQSFISLILSLPLLISNAFHRQGLRLPACAVRDRYTSRLVHCGLDECLSTFPPNEYAPNAKTNDQDDETALSVKYTRILWLHLISCGRSDEVARGIVDCLDRRVVREPRTHSRARRCLHQIVSSQGPRQVATLLHDVLLHVVSKKVPLDLTYSRLVGQSVLEASRDVRHAWVRQCIVDPKSLSSTMANPRNLILVEAVATLLSECKQGDNNNDSDEEEDSDNDDDSITNTFSPLRDCLSRVASAWSEPVFVQYRDVAHQHYVTHFLLAGLERLPPVDHEAGTRLLRVLLQGVSVRLESSRVSIRRDGMRIGECLSKRLGQPMVFEELDGHRQDANDETTTTSATEEMTVTRKTKKLPRKKQCSKPTRSMDPDALYISESDSSDADDSSVNEGSQESGSEDDNSVWGDNELIPYDLEDDEQDLQTTPAPLYLRECLALLRTPDSEENAYSRHEEGIKAIAKLVHSRPADLPDVAVPLCKQLLFMENKFDIQNFDGFQRDGLAALVVKRPVDAGEFLIVDFFDSECGLKTRMLVLSTLEEAAFELSGEKELVQARNERAKEEGRHGRIKVTGKRHLVGEEQSASLVKARTDVEATTRCWGRNRARENLEAKVINKFVSVAPAWFYRLIGGFMSHKDETRLWAGANGARLLASFLSTLATIVQRAGRNPGTHVLARHLIEFVWSFRATEVAEVRTAVLLALGHSLAQLPEDAYVAIMYGQSIDSLAEFLSNTAMEDSDETCRSLATVLSRSIISSGV